MVTGLPHPQTLAKGGKATEAAMPLLDPRLEAREWPGPLWQLPVCLLIPSLAQLQRRCHCTVPERLVDESGRVGDDQGWLQIAQNPKQVCTNRD